MPDFTVLPVPDFTVLPVAGLAAAMTVVFAGV
ncbi:hypothetical protein SCANM63S_08325 [Streptomyces canarius]